MLDMSCLMGSPSIPIFFLPPMNSGVVWAVVGFGIGNRLGHFVVKRSSPYMSRQCVKMKMKLYTLRLSVDSECSKLNF